MNDFTKDELELLRDNLHYPVDSNLKSKIRDVYDKLQSLVDNYCEPKSSCCSVHAGSSEECREECEHVSDGTFYAEALADDVDYKCKKCGEFYL